MKIGNLKGTLQSFKSGTGTTDASAQLEADSTTKGFLPPRMTTVQRDAISSPAEGLVVFDTDLAVLLTYAEGSWKGSGGLSIAVDTIMYVDGGTGDDANDGSSWLLAKKTFGFLYLDTSDAVPRRLDADLTVYARGNIYTHSTNYNLWIRGFNGPGTLSIIGETTDVETLTVDDYESDAAVLEGRTYIGDTSKTWTPDEHLGRVVRIAYSGMTTFDWPIIENTATRLSIPFHGNITAPATPTATIKSLDAVLMPATVAAPSTPISLQRFARVQDCTCVVNITNLDMRDAGNVSMDHEFLTYETYGPITIISCMMRGIWGWLGKGHLITQFCGFLCFDEYETVGAGQLSNLHIYNSGLRAMVSSPAIVSGLYSSGRESYISASSVTISGYTVAAQFVSGLQVAVSDLYIQDCAVGLDSSSSDLSISGNLKLKDVVTGIYLNSDISALGLSIVSVGVTTEIKTGDTTTETFANVNAKNPIANATMGTAITYYAWPATTFFDEYSNTGSGLAAKSFQGAIDELDVAVEFNTAKETNATHTGDAEGLVNLVIPANTVTYAKMQNVAADQRILGNIAGTNQDVVELTATQVRSLINVEDGADVTDATNVNAAGATMNGDTTLAGNGYFLDEDTLSSNDDTKVASQQSIKTYVDTVVASSKAYQGAYNAATNTPDLDTTPVAGIEAGDVWDVTVAGTFFTIVVEVGDMLTSAQASPTLEAHWVVTQANLTPASIKTQYESNADTNAYTDAEQAKLGGIETAATANSPDATLLARANHTGVQLATTVELAELGAATYDDVQDWSNSTQSAGVIDGGVITDGGSGTINVSAVKGIVKTTDSAIGANVYFDLALAAGLTLVDNDTNYIAVDYNTGTPQFVVGTLNTANEHTIFSLGKVYREGTGLDVVDSGLNIYDLGKRIQQHHLEESSLHFVSGAIVTETGTRSIALTAGTMYAGLNRMATDAIDTNVADDFEYYYYNGTAWVESDQTQIDNANYNDVTSGLVTLSNNQFGIHWVYKGTGTSTYVVYGQDSYTLTEAQAAQPPGSLPGHVLGFGVLRARIIIKEGAVVFTEIDSIEDVTFTAFTPSDHNELTNVQGGIVGERYHITLAETAALHPAVTLHFSATTGGLGLTDQAISFQVAANGQNGYLLSTDWDAFTAKAAANQTMYIGTTGVAINRASAALTLAGITLTTPNIGTPSAGVLANCTGLPVTGLANGTDGELITWSATGVAETVDVGTVAHVLTSNGPGVAPTFQVAPGGGSGDVVGPGSSTNNAIVRYDGTTGKLLQDNTTVLISDTGQISTGGETSPDVDPGGICLNHGAGSDSVLTTKSSDIAHPFTSLANSDTYLEIRKHVQVSGGALIRGFTETTTAFEYRGYAVTASTGSYAAIQLTAYLSDGGTGVTALTNNSNIVGFRNNSVMKHQFKGGGDAAFVGALTVGSRVGSTPTAGCIQWSGTLLQVHDGSGYVSLGDTFGPASATDNALPRFDGTGGKTLQASDITIDDTEHVLGVKTLGYATAHANGTITTTDFTLTLTNGQHQTVTLGNAATVLTIVDTGNVGDGTWRITCTQNTGGSFGITSATVLGGTVLTAGGDALTFTAAADSVDLLVIVKEGTKYYLQLSAKDLQEWT